MRLLLTCQGCGSGAATRCFGRQLCEDCARAENTTVCAFCGASGIVGQGSIHRDGFAVGPQVPLCFACADDDGPSCEEIWAKISTLKAAPDA